MKLNKINKENYQLCIMFINLQGVHCTNLL